MASAKIVTNIQNLLQIKKDACQIVGRDQSSIEEVLASLAAIIITRRMRDNVQRGIVMHPK